MTLRKILGSLLGSLFLLLMGCSNQLEGTNLGSLGPASPEPEYYGKPRDYSSVSTATVKMTARFRFRTLSFNPVLSFKNSTNGLYGISDNVIPYAEFHVYDASGARIQQGETTSAGEAIFSIPRTAGTYTLKVFSRALNNYVQASVLQDIYNNTPYSISGTVTLTSSQLSNASNATVGNPYDLSLSPIYAEASEASSASVEGGAFNIYYNIYQANHYIRTTIGKNNTSNFADKNGWWVADKVSAYWKAGFNPYSYVDASTSTLLSYYSPGQSKLYILGGTNGNVKTADTDHFDNSVILHEYAHFLEDRYGFSASPGGSHNGDFVIDPRLAWSEGWANYFQAAVRSYVESGSDGNIPSSAQNYFYVDTFGYKSTVSDSGGGLSIAFNLRQEASSASYDPVSPSAPSGEGVFREVSVARTLYKFTRGTGVAYATSKNGGGIPFSDLWKAFAGEDLTHHKSTSVLANSLRNSNVYPLPNFGLFNQLLVLNLTVSSTNMSAIMSEEKSLANQTEYAQRISSSGSSCSRSLSGVMESTLVFPRSNQLRNNDFFLYTHPGGDITLDYAQTSNCTNSSCTMDLDLIVYRVSTTSPYTYFEDYYIGTYTSSDIVAQKRTTSSLESIVSGRRTEQITSVAAGTYLVNVKINAYNKSGTVVDGIAQYNLRSAGAYLCP